MTRVLFICHGNIFGNENNNDSKLKFYVLRGLLHHNYTIL